MKLRLRFVSLDREICEERFGSPDDDSESSRCSSKLRVLVNTLSVCSITGDAAGGGGGDTDGGGSRTLSQLREMHCCSVVAPWTVLEEGSVSVLCDSLESSKPSRLRDLFGMGGNPGCLSLLGEPGVMELLRGAATGGCGGKPLRPRLEPINHVRDGL